MALRHRLTLLSVVLAAAAACAPQPAPTAQPAPIETPAPGEADAVRFREEFGLRADVGYVRWVASNPRATSFGYGVPLLPAEIRELDGRALAAADVKAAIREYGADHADDYGGVFVDSSTGQVVALFTSELEAHRAAIAARLRPGAVFDVRAVRNTKADLDKLLGRLWDERDWFAGVGLRVGASETDIEHNVVRLWVDGDDRAAMSHIAPHFGADGMLEVSWDPDPVAALPRGSLRGRVVDHRGRIVKGGGLFIGAIGDIEQAEPDDGIGYGVEANGTFVIPNLAAMPWTITIFTIEPDGEKVLGTARVVIHGGQESRVTIEIDGPQS